MSESIGSERPVSDLGELSRPFWFSGSPLLWTNPLLPGCPPRVDTRGEGERNSDCSCLRP